MKQNLVLTERIAAALKQEELGVPVSDIIRQAGITKRTFLRWKNQFGGLNETHRRESILVQENVTLKRVLVELALENSHLEDELEKKRVQQE
ncbi:putative transposase [Oxalobacteraceae bacterium GrIS 2.11]